MNKTGVDLPGEANDMFGNKYYRELESLSYDENLEVFKQTNCDGALIASILHYGETTIEKIKEELYKNNIPVRRI